MLAYIHIGCEKTGTTSVQAFLQANATIVRDAGWALPESGWFPNTTRLALACMDRERSDPDVARLDRRERNQGRENWRDDVWKAVADELRDASTPVRCMIASSEHFQAKLESDDEVGLLKTRLEQIGVTEFRIVVYLRRQVEYAISRYSTALRAGYSHRNMLPELLDDGNALFNYDSLLQRWSAIFGKDAIDVRLYERSHLVDGNVIDDFMRAVDLPADLAGLVRPARQNTALPIAAQLSIRALNEALEAHGVPRDKSVVLRRDVVRRLLEGADGPSLSPSRTKAIDFQRRFDASNGRVARRWFSRDTLFEDAFDYPDDEHDVAALDHLATVFARGVVDALVPPVAGKAR